MNRPGKLLNFASIALASLGLWESAAWLVRSGSFPHSWSVLEDTFQLLNTLSFWTDFLSTMGIAIAGFVLGSLIALFLGIVIGLNQFVEKSTRGSINFLRVIPSIVLLPLLIASIGSSPRTAVILTAFVVTFTFITYVVRGIMDTESQHVETIRLMKLSKLHQIIYLYLPSTLSLLGTGIRLSASRAFGTVVAAGIVAGTPGLGSKLYLAQTNANIERVFSYAVVMGVTGVFLYSVFSLLESRLFRWRVAV
jgi:ABC-type nitrate/sulfonate/bicarbonate transport system permease component